MKQHESCLFIITVHFNNFRFSTEKLENNTKTSPKKKRMKFSLKKMRAAAAPSAEIYRIERRKKNGS